MTFKDLLQSDNAEMLDLGEFARFIELDGILLKAQVLPSTEPISGKNFGGLYGDFLELHFLAADYTKKSKLHHLPKPGNFCFLAFKRYKVLSCVESLGFAILKMSAYRQENINLKNA